MKTIFRMLLPLAVISSFFAFTSVVDKTYYWEQYNIEITVPRDFKIVKNTSNEFEMKGDGMELFMYIWNQKKLAVEDMDEATVELAKELKLQEVDEEEAFKNGDFAGYYVEGFKDGDRVMLAGVVDLKSRTNFFIVITFDDKDEEAEKEALKILENIDHKD
ncbi:hypothetical protein FHS57_000289 [Runella defluvii]|uniref:DUF4252 domain-containing protein n=1 Tax=Runella defluvii TaxID=370973 RepID=A0A7W5ZI54_9BACT|nr:hypothetical protein [Runella defluvii]MBB3836307.1 hypothetical protein [Runella defluvii]